MHPIDAASPLRAETAESLAATQTVFILSVSGTDETTGQVLMARNVYPAGSIRWNETFKDVLEVHPDGTLHIDYSKFDEVEPLPAPTEEPSAGSARMN